MQYKKYCTVWLLVLAMVLSLALTGCGKTETEEEAETVSETPVEETAPEATTPVLEIDSNGENGIVDVTLIVNESEDGTQSVAGAAVKYGADIDAASLSASDFSVKSNGTEYYVSEIYTNSEAAFADGSAEGCYVILVLTENASEAEDESVGDTNDTSDGAEEPSVTPYVVDGEDEDVPEGPEGWDSDAEVILGSSPAEAASDEPAETEEADMLSVTVTQIDDVCTTDQVEIGPSPDVYESSAVVVA